MTHSPAEAAAYALEVTTAARSQLEATAAARSQLGATGAARSLCVAGATAIGAPTPIAPTVSVLRQWARQRSARLRRAPTTAEAVATTPTAIGFARTGTIRTERRVGDGGPRWSFT